MTVSHVTQTETAETYLNTSTKPGTDTFPVQTAATQKGRISAHPANAKRLDSVVKKQKKFPHLY